MAAAARGRCGRRPDRARRDPDVRQQHPVPLRAAAGGDQRGYRGTGLVQVYNPTTREEPVEANKVPASVPYAGDEGERAGSVYDNVQVLGDVSTGEFTRLMVNMSEWVAPAQGCTACHNTANFAEDTLYTKVVAGRML